jgi:NTP pyrophosphatase (non-canonical NTP hydrolase)
MVLAQAELNRFVRPEVSKEHILAGLEDITAKLTKRLVQKGYGSYASRHEILGILLEEMDEVVEAIRSDHEQGYVEFKKELLDVAIGALFGYICMGNYIKP